MFRQTASLSQVDPGRPLSPAWLHWLVIFLLVVGVVFRFVNLNHKVYWHDEVYTSLRASGYTVQEIGQEIFQNQVFSAKDLLRFQQIKPGSTPADTVRSLALEDPQHPPLYFLLDRFWVQALGAPMQAIFGSPLTASRLLPVLLSLLSLPFMYALAWELFASQAAALLATVFLALSPFDLLFAQTARQYSLLTLAVIASHYLLLRAIRLSGIQKVCSRDVLKRPPTVWKHWGLYALAVTLGLYTHPFFALTLIGHAVYIILVIGTHRQTSRQSILQFWLALAIAGLLYAPWLFVMLTGFQRTLNTTNWAANVPGSDYLVKLWTLSFTALFFDLDVGFDNLWTFVLRVPIVVLIVLAFYTLYRRCDRGISLFVWTSTVVPFLGLALPDLVLGSKRSAVSRYLISCYPGVQLAVAYFLAKRLSPKPHYLSSKPQRTGSSRFWRLTPYTLTFLNRWFWRLVLLTLFTASLASCTVSAASFTWWHNVPSYFNAAVADRLNAAPSPLLLSDRGDDFTNLGDLISLSYRLHPNVRMLLLSQNVNWVATQSFASQTDGSTIFAFRPSKPLRVALERSRGTLQPILPAARVWQVPE
ncbi:glycosyltransferase family 39 protein [Stenomitos frigidus]|uniref:Glycosyl transferase family 39 n=1 Tax=Stenomitos frigidus ULC18 TaxID=2107698 RepID=A0A2T1DZU3_9CYAN|nr:glycosyltransferase family 39 protein [Stenomitos frigidus]PSB26015.1 glycosyl transferase family 39 [Stenomitos frigidus ULC18]